MRWKLNLNLCNLTIICIGIFFLSGCAKYKYDNECFLDQEVESVELTDDEMEFYAKKEVALNHWLYNVIPRHRSQIQWYDLGHWCMWSLFGNDDDGIFGEEETANYKYNSRPSVYKAFAWYWRNPMHNFCFYVIGSAYCTNSELTLLNMSQQKFSMLQYDEEAKTVFPCDNTCFYLGLHGWKPFISLRLRYNPLYRSDFYLGWRCRGNFGAKCVLLTKKKLKSKTQSNEEVLQSQTY